LVRRGLVAVAAATTVVAVGGPAWASFADSSVPVEVSVGTAVVDAPEVVSLAVSNCYGIHMEVLLSWERSNARSVSGYSVAFQTGSASTVQRTGASTTSLGLAITKPNAATSVTVTASVTTLTTYGWTATSATVTATC